MKPFHLIRLAAIRLKLHALKYLISFFCCFVEINLDLEKDEMREGFSFNRKA